MTRELMERIRKLLALAQDAGATPGEAEAALGRAAHLQRLHGITEEALARHCHVRAGLRGIVIDLDAVGREMIYHGRRVGRWPSWIATACGRATGCRILIVSGRDNGIAAYGLAQDLAVCRELFAWCLAAHERARRAWARQHGLGLNARDAKAYADGWCLGLAEASRRAEAEAKADATPVDVADVHTANGSGFALVPVAAALIHEAKQGAIDRYLRARVGAIGKGRASTCYGGPAHAAGRADGSAVSLSRRAVR